MDHGFRRRSVALTAKKRSARGAPYSLQPRQDSNLDQTFRKRLFYPLNYGAVSFCTHKDATHL